MEHGDTEPRILGYTAERPARWARPWVAAGVCAVWVVVLTPLMLCLGLFSAGAGHGDYGFARAFFPYTMLSTYLARGEIRVPFIVLAVAEVPLYGVLLLLASLRSRRRLAITAAAILIVHTIAAVLCFIPRLPYFS